MEVILHIGAHRTGTTSFQNYVRTSRAVLDGQGIGFWGPWRTRNGLLDGIISPADTPEQATRAARRVQMNLRKSRSMGKTQLIVSDENLIGSCRQSLRAGRLYPDIGERMAKVHAGFGTITRVCFQIRSPEIWWSSALAFVVERGQAVPDRRLLEYLARSSRRWRDVISDIARACPDAEIQVNPFEDYAGTPDRLLSQMTGFAAVPTVSAPFWDNRSLSAPELRAVLSARGENPQLISGEGRWLPFNPTQIAHLRESYADDLFWLRAGADGLATMTEDTGARDEGTTPALRLRMRGQNNDEFTRRVAPDR